ncbi:MAG: dipeptide epimerase [Planctomycetes bacterium]|nr:dipeptide epimerase [Planctomycetota bacterium]
MRIDAVDIYAFDIRLHEPVRIATMISEVAPNVLIRLGTNGGVEGWGEASPLHSIVGETQATDLAAAAEIRPLLLHRNPLEIASIAGDIGRFLPHNPTIASAFDMALYDIAAKVAGLPLFRFLGGRKRPMETDLTIYIGDVESAGERALRVLEHGFRIIKTKVGASARDDVRRLTAIREAVGAGPALRIDANQGWKRMEAVDCLRALGDLAIEFCEQPVRACDVAGLRFVGDRSPIPIMADESIFSAADALRLVEGRAVPYFNIKLSKSGGIHEALSIARLAETAGIACMAGCMLESRLGITAAAHFALATDAVAFYDLDSFFEHAESPIAGGIEIRDGMIDIPDAPGIGAAPDPDFVKRLRKV